MPNSFSTRYLLLITALITGSSSINAANCKRTDIDHYLKQGFTPDQIVTLCDKSSAKTLDGDSAALTNKESTQSTPASNQANPKEAFADRPDAALTDINKISIYLQTVLDADAVKLTDTSLIITQDRCRPIGDENEIGQQADVCSLMETTISRKNLKIINTVDPVFLFRDAQFLVQSQVNRSVQFKERTHQRDKSTFLEQYPESANIIDLPLKKGHKPSEVAKTLEKITL